MTTKIGLEPVTIPNGLFVDPKRLTAVIRNVFEARAKDIKIDFKVTTQTWDTKPNFFIDRTGSNQFETKRAVGTDSLIYKWVNGGTKAHDIAPKNAPALVYQVGYKPKTGVAIIGSKSGGKFGPFKRSYKPVRHPGTAARKFDEVIAKKWTKLLPAIMERAIAAELSR